MEQGGVDNELKARGYDYCVYGLAGDGTRGVARGGGHFTGGALVRGATLGGTGGRFGAVYRAVRCLVRGEGGSGPRVTAHDAGAFHHIVAKVGGSGWGEGEGEGEGEGKLGGGNGGERNVRDEFGSGSAWPDQTRSD